MPFRKYQTEDKNMDRKEIKEIVKKMTLEEKCSLLTGINGVFTQGYEKYGIPSVNMMDGALGFREYGGNNYVCFPCAALMASSWDRKLAYEAGKHTAYEFIRAKHNVCLGPGNNMKRNPNCGRNFEYMSEDPYLGGIMSAEFVKGLQDNGIGACVKHYAVNNQETDRTLISAEVDERALRDYYLKAFEVCLDNSEPVSVMCAYNKVNGVYCAENKYLLSDILKGDYKFDGMVISDWGAVHDSAKSIAAGLDLEMPPNKNMTELLLKGIEDGKVTEEEIDKAAENIIIFAKKVANLKKSCYNYNREEQHKAAQKIAAEGMVLLKNEDNVLPITSKKYKKILVVGQLAQKPVYEGSGAAKVEISDEIADKPLDYIKEYAKANGIEVGFDPVYEYGSFTGAENIGKINSLKKGEYDAIICFAGNNYGSDTETEYWDRENIKFPNYINGMIYAATFKCDNVIVVMQTGSCVIPTHWHKKTKGIIQMWYGGEGGGKAIADILFGHVNPSGKLSETFALKERDMDIIGDGKKTWYKESLFVGYRYYDENEKDVWFPFGHGLSYTEFHYSGIKTRLKNDSVEITFKLKNAGEYGGAETVQAYIGKHDSEVIRPKKELMEFLKVYLNAGEEKELCMNIPVKSLRYYNTSLRAYKTESGKYNIYIGSSSMDIRLCDSFILSDGSEKSNDTSHIMA